MPNPARTTNHCAKKRHPVVVNADSVDRSVLVATIVAAMIGDGGSLRIGHALRWKARSGEVGFRQLLMTAQGLGIEVRSNGRPIKLVPLGNE